MKKNYYFLMLACSVLLFSCKNKNEGGMSDKAKKNLEAANAVNKMFETMDFSKLGDYVAADAVDHTGMTGDVKGIDSIKAEFMASSGYMKDMKNNIVKELADDDYVFQWNNETWTVVKDEMGMKAGQRASTDAIEVSKFKDGKITDHWGFISYNDMMKMMSSSAGQNNNNEMNNNMPPKDTAH